MPNLTRADLVTLIGQYIQDPNHTEFTEAEKQAKIQEAQEQFVADTRALTDTQTFSVVAGTNTYTLDDNTLDIIRVGLNGVKLRRFGKFDIDFTISGDWSATQGTPIAYYLDSTSTNKKLTLYPIPANGDSGTDNLVVEYVVVPTVLSGDSSQPLDAQVLLQPYLTSLAYYASAQFLNIRSNPQEWVKADRYMKIYRDKVSDCRETFVALSDTAPMRMRGGRYFKGL